VNAKVSQNAGDVCRDRKRAAVAVTKAAGKEKRFEILPIGPVLSASVP
jgi:hypothetical protein